MIFDGLIYKFIGLRIADHPDYNPDCNNVN
jgi:hypothetical protein